MASSQIRDSLMKIKRNQIDLLAELRTQHQSLQKHLCSEPSYSPFTQPFFTQDFSYQNSLQLSKSMDNLSGSKNPLTLKGTVTTNAEDLLQSNYKKIEQLLLKQRKLYEENHALHEENESLNQDYQTVKKLYYQLKQIEKQKQKVQQQIMSQIVQQILADLVQYSPHKEIFEKIKKNFSRIKLESPKLLQYQKIQELLMFQLRYQNVNKEPLRIQQQNLVASKGTTKQMQVQIQRLQAQLKEQRKRNEECIQQNSNLMHLLKLQQGRKVNEKQRERQDQSYIKKLRAENMKVLQDLRRMQLQKTRAEIENRNKIQLLEKSVMSLQEQRNKIFNLLNQKQSNLRIAQDKLRTLQEQSQNLAQSKQKLKIENQNLKQSSREKQQLYETQVQLTKRQNLFIEKLTQDIAKIQAQAQAKSQMSIYQAQIQQLQRELGSLRGQYQNYRQHSSRQIISLSSHNKEIKNQLNMVLKSEENARINEMRYKQLNAIRSQQMRLNNTIDHLWEVKEIEYQNINELMAIINLSLNENGESMKKNYNKWT